MTIQQWLNMGFTEKQAEMIQKYRSAGGEFYTKEDLSKLWCISNNEYKILEPYILLPSKNDSIYINRFKQNATKPSKINIIEINTASEEKLMEIPGIGKYYAEQIIKYRRRLGGYCSKQQLMEIYNMDSSKYNKISKYISINANVIRKININTASFEDLQKHPYFTYNTSLALINYRETHGKFNKIEDIKKCDLFTQELYIKLIPYIKIE
jgi:DNA uptake protein ComE-like DNA-binding protein